VSSRPPSSAQAEIAMAHRADHDADGPVPEGIAELEERQFEAGAPGFATVAPPLRARLRELPNSDARLPTHNELASPSCRRSRIRGAGTT
jgi:hypothetical protein